MKTFKEFREILNFIKRGPERKGYYIKGVPKARVDKKGSAQVSKPRKGSWNDRQLKMTNEGVASLAIKGGSKLIPALMTGIGAAGTIMQSKKKDDVNITPRNLKNLENAVFRGKTGRKLDGEILKRREQKEKMKGVIKPKEGEITKQRELVSKAEKEVTKPKSGEKQKAKKVVDTFKKVRKIEGKTMMKNKEDMEILKKGPGDLVPKARKTYLDKLLKNLRKEEVMAAPTNSTGSSVPGTGDDSSTVVVNKKKPPMLRRKTYAKGGVKSRKPWLDYLKNKYT